MNKKVKNDPVRDKLIILSNKMGIGLSVTAAVLLLISSYSFFFDILLTAACCCILWHCRVRAHYSSPSVIKLSLVFLSVFSAAVLISGGYYVFVIAKEQITNGFTDQTLPIIIRNSEQLTAFRSPAYQMLSGISVYLAPMICLAVIIVALLKKKKSFIGMSSIYKLSAVTIISAFSGIFFYKFSVWNLILMFLLTAFRTVSVTAVMLRLSCIVNSLMRDDRKRCTSCGNFIPDGKKFCIKCGAKAE